MFAERAADTYTFTMCWKIRFKTADSCIGKVLIGDCIVVFRFNGFQLFFFY